MLKPQQVETWAVRVLERCATGTFREDALVELKSDWIDPYKAARRIAGHANAARGNEILWIVGVQEDGTILGASRTDLAAWLPSVWKWFEGPHPAPTDVEVTFSGKVCSAISFDTLRPPYVVKNLNGCPISSEVPWREGTSTRTAKRDELLRILSDFQLVPDVEVLSARVFAVDSASEVGGSTQDKVRARFEIGFYIMSRTHEPLVIPHHRVVSRVLGKGGNMPRSFDRYHYTSKASLERSIRHRVLGVGQIVATDDDSEKSFEDTGSELVIRRAAHVVCHADLEFPDSVWQGNTSFSVEIIYHLGIERQPFTIACEAIKSDQKATAVIGLPGVNAF